MTGFASKEVKVVTGDGLNFELLEPLVFTRPDGEVITALPGATTDGASSPRETWAITPPFGRYWLAAVLHDAMYRLKTKPLIVERETADYIFLEAMCSLGVPVVERNMLYDAVRIGGEASWIQDRTGQ